MTRGSAQNYSPGRCFTVSTYSVRGPSDNAKIACDLKQDRNELDLTNIVTFTLGCSFSAAVAQQGLLRV